MGGTETVTGAGNGSPEVTVLMAVHNGEAHLRPAIDSVLSQTFTNYEFLIIDDGSTDETPAIIASIDDARIRMIRNETNIGLAASLNKGLAAAKGRYVARMDADDICQPERLAKQVHFLDAHSETVVLGTEMVLFGRDGEVAYWRPKTDAQVKAHLLFAPPFAHPSVMLRKTFLDTHALRYDESLPTAQDYDLWERMLRISGAHGANLKEPLLSYRVHDKSISTAKLKEQRKTANDIRERALAPIVPNRQQSETMLHHKISTLSFECSREFVASSEQWLKRLVSADKTDTIYTDGGVLFMAGRHWFELCHHAAPEGPSILATYYRSPLSKGYRPRLSRQIRFAAKSLLGRFRNGGNSQ